MSTDGGFEALFAVDCVTAQVEKEKEIFHDWVKWLLKSPYLYQGIVVTGSDRKLVQFLFEFFDENGRKIIL